MPTDAWLTDPELPAFRLNDSVSRAMKNAYDAIGDDVLKCITFSIRDPYFRNEFSIFARVGTFSYQPLLYGFFRPASFVDEFKPVQNAAQRADRDLIISDFTTRENIGAVARRVLSVGGHPEGILHFNYRDSRHKLRSRDEREIDQLSVFLNRKLLEIRDSLLHERIVLMPRLLHLLDIGDAITQRSMLHDKGTLREALTEVLRMAMLAAGMNPDPRYPEDPSLGLFGVVNEHQHTIDMAAAINFDEAFTKDEFKTLKADEQIGSSSQLVVHLKRAIVFDFLDPADLDLLDRREKELYRPTRSGLACALNVPMISRGHTIGMMSLESAEPLRVFRQPIFIRLLQTAASLAAGMIISFHHEIQRQRSNQLISACTHDLSGDILDRIKGNANRIVERRKDASSVREAEDIIILADYLWISTRAMKQVVTEKAIAPLFQSHPFNDIEIDVAKVNFPALLASAAHITLLTTASSHVEVNDDDIQNPFVRGDRALLLVCVVNLLRNSMTYVDKAHEGKAVQCILSHDGERKIRVQIHDWGKPMFQDVQKRLFKQPLGQRKHGGTGHGCFVSAEIIRAHGCEIFSPVPRFDANHRHIGWVVGFTVPVWDEKG